MRMYTAYVLLVLSAIEIYFLMREFHLIKTEGLAQGTDRNGYGDCYYYPNGTYGIVYSNVRGRVNITRELHSCLVFGIVLCFF